MVLSFHMIKTMTRLQRFTYRIPVFGSKKYFSIFIFILIVAYNIIIIIMARIITRRRSNKSSSRRINDENYHACVVLFFGYCWSSCVNRTMTDYRLHCCFGSDSWAEACLSYYDAYSLSSPYCTQQKSTILFVALTHMIYTLDVYCCNKLSWR